MPRVQKLKPEDFANANKLLLATFGLRPKQRLYEDQVEGLTDSARENRDEAHFPKAMDVLAGKYRQRDYEGKKIPLIKKNMPFAGRYLFSSDRLNLDLTKIAYELMAALFAATPRDTGFLRNKLYFVVNGNLAGASKSLNPPQDGFPDGTRIGIVNLAEYGIVHESPSWDRPFYKVFRRFNSRYKQFDWGYRFIPSDAFGGTLARRSGKRRKYTIPLLEFAVLGGLGDSAGFQYKRRKSKKDRRNRKR